MHRLEPGDGLLIVDIQKDFLPGGALGIHGGDAILPAIREYLSRFERRGLPIFLSRDWHPENHCSFQEQGGPWPRHCVAGSPGSLPPPDFRPPTGAKLIFKATTRDKEAYSAFEGTRLDEELRAAKVRRLFIGGLATDYCVVNTVKDARTRGYDVVLLQDAICGVDVQPGDSRRAIDTILGLGALPLSLERLAA